MKNLATGLILKSLRVVTPEGVRPGAVLVSDGVIESVAPLEGAGRRGLPAQPVLDFGNLALMPGLVDAHVHVNEPGRTAWEGFASATAAAAAGGITTIVDMPLNSDPVTTSLRAFEKKLASAEPRLRVDAGFWGGVVPGNLAELAPMLDAGVLGFKAFLVHSGIDDFPQVGERDLLPAMTALARRGAPLLVHAELECSRPSGKGAPNRYATYLASRPKEWENAAIELLVGLCRKTRCRVHIVHLSSAEALPIVAKAKAEGLPLTAETCPHYLTFSSEEVPDGRTEFKCSPPIRESSNREKLWKALADGVIDFVASDHSPCLPKLKRLEDGNFMAAWGGVSSLQWLLPAVWTEARRRGHDLSRVARWLCEAPAAFAGLGSHKGRIARGQDADIVVWDPEAEFEADPKALKHKHRLSPYAGRKLRGVVAATFLRGRTVWEGAAPAGRASGRLLLRRDD